MAAPRRIADAIRRVQAAVLAAAVVTTAGLAAGSAAFGAVHGGHGRITLGGRVGALRLDRSARADVVRFAGRPDKTARGNFDALPHRPNYRALGYDCRAGRPVLSCRTVFFINTRTTRLAGFYSSSPRYSFRGARPGMRTAVAARRMRRPAVAGCLSGFQFLGTHTHASLWGSIRGGRYVAKRGRRPRIVGGRLAAFSLESNVHPVGELFC